MKLEAVGKIIQRHKNCRIAEEEDGQQWLGTNACLYAVEDSYRVSVDNALALASVPREKREKINVMIYTQEVLGLGTQYTQDDEANLLNWIGEIGEVILLVSRDGVLWGVEKKALAPVENDNGLAFALRGDEDSGQYRIAVFDDIFCGAVLCPVARDALENIQTLCKLVAGKRLPEAEE